MFSFKSIALILAAAAAVVTAMPTANGAALAARVEQPAVVVRAPVAAPEAALNELVARGGPQTIPDCVSSYNNNVAPIFVQIDAAVKAKVSVTVLVNLWLKIVVELKALIVNLKALVAIKASVDIFAGLKIDVIAKLFVDLVAVIVVKLQACVSILGLLDILVFLNVFLQIEAQISACIRAIVVVAVGINVILDVQLKASIDALVVIATQLGAVLTVIADLQALLVL